ncbi:MAG: hypothetical protein E7478_04090 [Ruminococcaceae bacterium]|nr:hypothetical protein [Oscillospiraceae bacterium]
MSVDIKSEYVAIGGTNVLLVSVKGGSAVFGTCSAGHNLQRGDISTLKRIFYIANEPVVVMNCPNNGDKRTDRIMSISPGFGGMPHEISQVFAEALAKINRGESLEMGLREIFMLMPDGVYTVYPSEYYPTDGSGIFFWGAYNVGHEVHGTADYNRTIGMDKTYRPCFLVPCKTLDFYTQKNYNIAKEYVKSAKFDGITFHLSGLHSVLLRGYHNAAACAASDIPFKCAVIERISDPFTMPYAIQQEPQEPQPEGENAEDAKTAEAAAPKAAAIQEGITGFRSASVKLPIDIMPKEMLRILLENRREYKPTQYAPMISKLSVVRRRTVSNNVLPLEVLEKCELMPDCEMIESAFAINSLNEEQLQALLNGDVECNGEVIITPNFYSSIVTACNYLQFHDEKRFIEFAISIMENPELYATHEYIAKRVSRVGNKKIYQYFKSVIASGDPRYEKILVSADRYVKDYDSRH